MATELLNLLEPFEAARLLVPDVLPSFVDEELYVRIVLESQTNFGCKL